MIRERGSMLERLADRLRSAETSRRPIDALTDQMPDLTIAEAYRIQAINLAMRVAGGERLVGRKIGLTSKAMQEQLGVTEPDVGAITDTMVLGIGQLLETTRFIAPRVEAEFAFRLDSDVEDPASMDSVRASIGSVMLAAEIIDSRIRDWKIKLADTVADNASSAAVIFGAEVPATPELIDRLADLRVELAATDDVVGFGFGSAVLGHPLHAVSWLARTLAATGDSLRAGDFVLAGAVHASVPLTAGIDYAIRATSFPDLSFSAV